MTKAEGLMRNIVLKEDKTWYRFLRQKIIKSFILDFYCSKLKLGIEIDWSSHDGKQEYDQIRSNILSHCGILLIRYTNHDIEKNIDGVMIDLHRQIQERKKERKKEKKNN
jgi:very-short-patch-repair endonuclease